MPQVCISIDVEPDCPPYLSTYRGVETGIALLLELFAKHQIAATFFCTGDVARKYPNVIQSIVSAHHELASHGDMHLNYSQLTLAEAHQDITAASQTLRQFASVVCFRAPYLQFPAAYLPLLIEDGYLLDSSQAKYKRAYYRQQSVYQQADIQHAAVSTTSSVLRLPRFIRHYFFATFKDPIVLFVHPWEFVDLRQENLRLDCRFKTGPAALHCLSENINYFKARGAQFLRMRELIKPTAT